MTHATPRPWEAVASMESTGAVDIVADRVTGADSFPAVIATVYGNEGEPSVENAALIVHAVNTLDEAKAVLIEASKWFGRFEDEKHSCELEVHSKVLAVLAKLEGV